jgi:hypothetical protein
MLTKHPNIVYALPARRTRRKKATALHADIPRIVDATRKPSPLDEVDQGQGSC